MIRTLQPIFFLLLVCCLPLNAANGGVIWEPPGPDILLGVSVIDYGNLTGDPERLVVGGVALSLNVSGNERFTIKFGTPAAIPDVAAGLENDIKNIFSTFDSSDPGFFALDAIVDNNGTLKSGSFYVFGILDDAGSLTTSIDTQLLLKGTLVGIDTSSYSTDKTIQITATTDEGNFKTLFPSTFDITLEGFPDSFFADNFIQDALINGSVGSTVPEPMSAVIWSSALLLGGVLNRRRRMTMSL